jgi:hypothetical protein
MDMIGAGWPTEYVPAAGTEAIFWRGLLGLLALAVFGALVMWSSYRARKAVAPPEVHIEHPADFRKAA